MVVLKAYWDELLSSPEREIFTVVAHGPELQNGVFVPYNGTNRDIAGSTFCLVANMLKALGIPFHSESEL